MANVQLQFTNDQISVLGSGALAGSYSGTLVVNYTTGQVTGSITTSPALGSTLPLLTYANFTETFNALTNTYTLSSNDNATGVSKFTITYSGSSMTPSTSTSALAPLGLVNLFSGTNDLVVSTPVCYASGTRIRTDLGDRPVETLQVGDIVVTASGERKPIKWLGHRTIDTATNTRPREVHPVRIAAHAFGEGLPARDLVVSPAHAICVDVFDQVLIPAVALVNGSTVTQSEVASVTYWHLELEGHDIVLAEGLPSESYIDCGNRRFFAESEVVDLAAGPDGDAGRKTTDDYCRPFHGEGAIVNLVRAWLQARAEWPVSRRGADGARVDDSLAA